MGRAFLFGRPRFDRPGGAPFDVIRQPFQRKGLLVDPILNVAEHFVQSLEHLFGVHDAFFNGDKPLF
jgi:hypothetical protein